MFRVVFVALFLVVTIVLAESETVPDNYQEVLKNTIKSRIEMEKQLAEKREKLINSAKKLIRKMSDIEKGSPIYDVPRVALSDEDGNLYVMGVEDGWIYKKKIENAPVTSSEQIIRTETNVSEVNPSGLNAVIKLIAGVIYIFGSVYFLLLAYRNFLQREFGYFLVDMLVWLITTGIMGKLYGLI